MLLIGTVKLKFELCLLLLWSSGGTLGISWSWVLWWWSRLVSLKLSLKSIVLLLVKAVEVASEDSVADGKGLWSWWLDRLDLLEDLHDSLWGVLLVVVGLPESLDLVESLFPLLGGKAEPAWAPGLRDREGLLSWPEDSLDFVAVGDALKVGVGEEGPRELEALLGLVDAVESVESTLGPDDEPAQNGAWGELVEGKAGDALDINTWDVPESLDNALVLVVNDKWALAGLEGGTPHAALGGTVVLAVDDLGNIGVGLDGLEEGDGILGLLDLLDFVGDDDWDFGEFLDLVAAGFDEGGDGGSGDGGGNSITPLLDRDWAEPAALGGWWLEAVTATAEVSVGTLAIPVGAGAVHTWDTGLSTTWTP